jgi:hypothetical protein
VQVHYPASQLTLKPFSDLPNRGDIIYYEADPNPDWQASFFRSVGQADGVIMLGGGWSTLTIGYIALGLQLPVLTIAPFGGAAHKVWAAIRPEADLPSLEEHRMLGSPWTDYKLKDAVDALYAQLERRAGRSLLQDRKSRELQQSVRALTSMFLILVALSMAAAGNMFRLPPGVLVGLLYMVGPIAGSASALGLSAWEREKELRPIGATVGLGLLAGATASLVYILATLSTASGSSEIRPLAIGFATLTGLTAGYGLDRIFKAAAEGRLGPHAALAVEDSSSKREV